MDENLLFRILDKLLSGEYSFSYILLTLLVGCACWYIYLYKESIYRGFCRLKQKILLRKNNEVMFMQEFKPFSRMESEVATLKFVPTGDFVKDQILYNLIDIIGNTCKEKVIEYIKSVDFDDLDVDIVHKQCSDLMTDILKSIKNQMADDFPKPVYSKVSEALSYIEEMIQYEVTEYNDCGESAEQLLAHMIKTICGHFSGVMNSLSHLFHSMNGSLNGVDYHGIVVGVYDSYKVPKGNYPLPNASNESEANSFAGFMKNDTGCSSVSFFAVHDSDTKMTEDSDIGNRMMSMTYSSDGYINKSRYQRQLVLRIINADLLDKRVKKNLYIYAEREREYDFSNLKNYMSANKLAGLVVQPVLRNKEELIGFLFLEWCDIEGFDIKSIEDKLHGYAARCLRFFSYS